MFSAVRLPGNAVLQSWTGSVPEDLLPTQRHPSQVSLLLFLCQFLSPFSVPLSVSQLLLPLSLLPPSPPSLSSLPLLPPSLLPLCLQRELRNRQRVSHSWSCQTGKFIRSSYFFDELSTKFCWCEFERDERERDGNCLQARTLRLMANAYLEWDGQTYWQKALNAVGGYDPVFTFNKHTPSLRIGEFRTQSSCWAAVEDKHSPPT